MSRIVYSFIFISCIIAGNKLIAGGGGHKSDTLRALVVDTKSDELPYPSDLSEIQLIHIIDSLLDEDKLPEKLIDHINSKAYKMGLIEESKIALTGFYDDTEFPSNSFYNNWDEVNINPKIHSKLDLKSYKLVLEDSLHFCNYYPPVKGLITSNFGWRDGRNHYGIDIDLQVWDPVKAAFDGMVRIVRYNPSYGRVIVIRHYNGLETVYAHLHRFKVKVGDVVQAGQLIGLGGSSGHSTGSHLHFEVRFKGVAINPKSLISFNNNKLISDSVQLVENRGGNYRCIPLGIDYYTVQKGDFLYKIANRYGISVNRICELNGIRRQTVLKIGKKLRLD